MSRRAARKTSLRDEAKQETREALITAAMEAFAAEGLDAPSLDAICARAGYTRGAFYVHFDDRDDLIVAVMERSTTGFLRAVLGSREEAFDIEKAITGFAEAVESGMFPLGGKVRSHQFGAACARSKALRESYGALIEEATKRVEAAIEASQRTGRVREDIDADRAARLLILLVQGVETAIDLGLPFDLRALSKVTLKLLRA